MTEQDPTKMSPEEMHMYAVSGGDMGAAFEKWGKPGGPTGRPVPKAADVPMKLNSIRLPLGMVEAIEAIGHPEGKSGVLREAVAEWLERHAGIEAETSDARQALNVLERIVNRQSSKLAQ